MTKRRTIWDLGCGREHVLATLERTVAEARQLLGEAVGQVYASLAFRPDYVDVLFRKAVRCFDALVAMLEADAGRDDVDWTAEVDRFRSFGLRRDDAHAWETDYLALEYGLGRDAVTLFAHLEAFARESLRPRVAPLAAAA
jgi:hypothetical protein